MFSIQSATPRSNGFRARYFLPSHWPLTFVWLVAPPQVTPPLKDRFPVPYWGRGLLRFLGLIIAVVIIVGLAGTLIEPVADLVFYLLNGWTMEEDIAYGGDPDARYAALYIALGVIAIIPASIQATAFANKPCGLFYVLSLIERVIGEILQAPFRHVKAQLGGQRRIIEEFDLPPPPGPAESKHTECADSWLCAPDPDTRWAGQSRPELAIALRRLLVTRYHLRTTFGAMLFYTIIPLYYGVLFACFGFVAYPIFMAVDRYDVVMAWIVGIIWVVISVGALIILCIRVLGHSNAYATRAKKRAAKSLPPELALLEAAEVALRRRYTNWWEKL